MNVLENAISNRGYKALAGLVAIVVLACTACSTPSGPVSAPRTAGNDKTAKEPKETQRYTESKDADIEAAKDTVKKYWIATSSSYEGMYELFSSNYKDILSTLDGIRNAEDFKESIPPTKRIWPKQTLQSARFDADRDPPQIRIVVLSEWKEKEYSGGMTFIFDLVKEGDEWKIANIMF